MDKTRYVVKIEGSRSVVRMLNPKPYKVVYGTSPGNIEKAKDPPSDKPASDSRPKKKRD